MADFSALIMVISYLTRGALNGDLAIHRTPLDKPILIFLCVLGLSMIHVVDLPFGIRNYFRHVQLFIIFYILSSGLQKSDIKRTLTLFLVFTSLHSTFNIFQSLFSSGHIRSFGIAGVFFNDILVVSLLIAYSFYLFHKDVKKKRFYGLVFFVALGGLVVSQTRGAVLSFLLGYFFVTVVALKKARDLKLAYVKRNFLRSTGLILTILLVFMIFSPSILLGFSHRFYTITQGPAETIELRFVLWGTAVKSFLQNPILGVGLGQFARISQVLPELRFNPLFAYVSGLGAHNIVLSYLTETGILGLLCLFYLMLKSLRLGWINFKRSKSEAEVPISVSLLGVLFFVVASSFYAGEWFWSVSGMLFMFLLALLVVFNKSMGNENELWRRQSNPNYR
ncbi:MAG: O-antigen ligase family protein [candidate division Zixibacteria bacterium]|nr:O-antigen ligase family protein [candidate division Zixibacteria bacterium]